MGRNRFVPTKQQVRYQELAISDFSIDRMERELFRRGCRWIDVSAPPEGFYREINGPVPWNWAKARQIVRGDIVVGDMEDNGSLEDTLREALSYVRAQDEFRDRSDCPPGMEPPKGPVPVPWEDVYQAPRWLFNMYQNMAIFDHRPDPLPSFDDLMGMASSWAVGKDWDTGDSILMEEFEVVAFPEEDGRWGSVFYFSKALTGPDDRIVWPGDSTWIDAPVRKVGFFFLPESYWSSHVQMESTHNPPTVDLKWPWRCHLGVVVD